MIKAAAEKIFWGSYWKIYGKLCLIKPYRQSVERAAELLNVAPRGAYLDLACGLGITTRAIFRKGAIVIGADYSASAIEAAKRQSPYQEYPGLSYCFADMNSKLPFDNGQFDGILAHNSMYLARNPFFTLSEVHRVMAPGGRFVMSTPIEGASPFKIVQGHLRAKYDEFLLNSRTAFYAKLKMVPEAAKTFSYFLLFLPFQIALKNKAGGGANFWPQEKWTGVIEELNKQGYSFKMTHVEPSYAGQNITFALKKV